MNLPLQNLETWELQQAIVAMNQAQKYQVDFIRRVLRKHRIEVAKTAMQTGSKIVPEFMREDYHPLVGAQSPDVPSPARN